MDKHGYKDMFLKDVLSFQLTYHGKGSNFKDSMHQKNY